MNRPCFPYIEDLPSPNRNPRVVLLVKMAKLAVYLFFQNRYSEFDYSFLKIDVEEYSKGKEMLELKQSIFEFPSREYPFGMGCAQLGEGSSMFYFCGGFHLYSDSLRKQPNPALKPMELLNYAFPPCIYTLDAAADDVKLHKLDAQMHTGKSTPIVFAAKGKIYVLCAIGCVRNQLYWWYHNHKGSRLEVGLDVSTLVRLFECYDPVDDEWKVLPDSPLQKLSTLHGYLILQDQHKMVLTASKEGYGKCSHFLYDLNQDTWLYELDENTCIYSSMLQYVNNWAAHYVRGFSYGLGSDGFPPPIPFKLGPFHLKNEDDPPAAAAAAPNYGSTISFVDPHDTLHLAYGFNCTSMLQHLGDACFLYVSSAQALINNDFDRDDPYAHNVFITIFKDVDADAYVSSFKSKIIFSQDYVSKTDSDCHRKLRGCFHVSTPLPTIKEPIMDSV